MKQPDSRSQSSTNLLGYRENRQQYQYSRYGRLSNNLPNIYKNPQIHISQSPSDTQLSFVRKCLLLSPGFAFQFCTVLTSVFSIINLQLLEVPISITSVHLVVAAGISIALTFAVQKCTHNLFDDQKLCAKVLAGFTAYLSVGSLLVLIANLKWMSGYEFISHNDTGHVTAVMPVMMFSSDNLKQDTDASPDGSYQSQAVLMNTTGNSARMLSNTARSDPFTDVSKTANASWDVVMTASFVPLHSQIMAFIGYAIMASSLSCGYYLVSGVATSLEHKDDHGSNISIQTTATAFGGCAVSFLGVVDVSVSGYPYKESTFLLIGQIFILLCITTALLIGCTACSVITCYIDTFIDMLRPVNDIEDKVIIAYDRRPTRTAQEMFDECATLLGHQVSVSYTEDNISPRKMPTECEEDISNSICQSETAVDGASVYRSLASLIGPSQRAATFRESTPPRSSLVVPKSQKKPLQAMLVIFFLYSCLVSMEYNSSLYLSYVIPEDDDRWGRLNYRKGARIASAGAFITHLFFIVVHLLCGDVLQPIGWKPLAMGVSLLAALLALTVAISNEVAVYFAACCVLGLVRVVMVGLLHHLVQVRSQTGYQSTTVRQNSMETISTAIWWVAPLSLGVSSAVFSPLTGMPGFHEIAMYYSAASAVIACVSLWGLS